MLWRGFQKPKRLSVEMETLTEKYGKFSAQPFERGFGTTIGNALRRVLLSSVEGAAVTAVHIEGVLHEFQSIPGVVEDATDIILNLKQVPFKLNGEGPKAIYLRADKPGIVTSGMIEADSDVDILDKDVYIATVSEGGKLEMEMRLKRGRSYISADKNFDSDLGWSPGELAKQADGPDRELFSTDELVRMFSLDGIAHSNAVFNNDKLAWYNTEYIRAYDPARLLPLIEEEWRQANYKPTRSRDEILATIPLLQQRARSLKDFSSTFLAYFGDKFEVDPAALQKFLSNPAVVDHLAELGQRYASLEVFDEPRTEQLLRDFAAEKGVKAGALINGARVLLTGQSVAPSLFTVMVCLGQQRVVHRLQAGKQAIAL